MTMTVSTSEHPSAVFPALAAQGIGRMLRPGSDVAWFDELGAWVAT